MEEKQRRSQEERAEKTRQQQQQQQQQGFDGAGWGAEEGGGHGGRSEEMPWTASPPVLQRQPNLNQVYSATNNTTYADTPMDLASATRRLSKDEYRAALEKQIVDGQRKRDIEKEMDRNLLPAPSHALTTAAAATPSILPSPPISAESPPHHHHHQQQQQRRRASLSKEEYRDALEDQIRRTKTMMEQSKRVNEERRSNGGLDRPMRSLSQVREKEEGRICA